MCGFCGVISVDGDPPSVPVLQAMSASLVHRGPDSSGTWLDDHVGIANRRLAIIDLSQAADLPMSNEDGRFILGYNGELYNYLQLRSELQQAGHRFRSSSDAEVIVHAFEEWGERCLDRFNGMFAFAIWDTSNRALFLARDRYGVKPLYYFWDGTKLVFASEIKPILAFPGIEPRVCHSALDQYFTFQNVLTDETLFAGIRLLPPGHCLKVDIEGSLSIRQYWDFDFTSQLEDLSFQDAAEELRRLFVNAVTRQLVSDVPIASYLSGGLDSGSICAVAGKHLKRIMTFTAGFDLSSASGLELGFDERTEAEFLSNLLKTEHYEMVLHAGDMERVLPELVWHLEDLRVGQSYPNYCVARLAGKFVKVVLSGAGGDELFGGYPWRYYRGSNGESSGDYYRRYYEFWQRLVPDDEKQNLFNDRTRREMLPETTFDAFRRVFRPHMPLERESDRINASLYFELKTFLHGLLIVEDRVSMAHSLETRVPFLDNDVVEFACRLSPLHKLAESDQALATDENDIRKYAPVTRTRGGKQVLRAAMSGLVPPAVTQRVKQGFSAPDASWFRGESIDYVNQFLRPKRARIYEYLEHAYVTRKLDEHCGGKSNHRLLIWSLLSFEWWLRKFLS